MMMMMKMVDTLSSQLHIFDDAPVGIAFVVASYEENPYLKMSQNNDDDDDDEDDDLQREHNTEEERQNFGLTSVSVMEVTRWNLFASYDGKIRRWMPPSYSGAQQDY